MQTKILPEMNLFSPLLQILTNFPNKKVWSHWCNTYCTHDILFHKGVYANKCPPCVLWLAKFPQDRFSQIRSQIQYTGVKSVCIKSKQSSNVSFDVCETKPFFAPVFSNCLYKDDTTIQSCNIFLDGDGGAGGRSGDLTVIFAVFKHSASLCQSCSSGSCSSRSWYVSQEAGGVRLWR